MYRHNKISNRGNITTLLNTAVFVISYTGYLLYLLAKFTITAIFSIAKATTITPKFKHKNKIQNPFPLKRRGAIFIQLL